MTVSVAVAVLGLGEAGSQIARDLVAAGADVRGYDPKVADVPGVAPRISEADAVRDADLVLNVKGLAASAAEAMAAASCSSWTFPPSVATAARDLLTELPDRQSRET